MTLTLLGGVLLVGIVGDVLVEQFLVHVGGEELGDLDVGSEALELLVVVEGGCLGGLGGADAAGAS